MGECGLRGWVDVGGLKGVERGGEGGMRGWVRGWVESGLRG